MEGYERIVYSLNVFDIQRVAVEEFGRALTEDELKTTENSLGDYIHWYDAIEMAIRDTLESEHRRKSSA